MRVFKYLHPDRIDVLRHQALRFTQPEYLNDRFELRPAITRLASEDKYEEIVDQYIEKNITDEYIDENIQIELFKIKEANPEIKEYFESDFFKSLSPEAWRLIFKDSFKFIKPYIVQSLNSGDYSQHFINGLQQQIGILSLSETYDNSLMWAHYADSNRGFIIEFDSKNPFFINNKIDIKLLQKIQKVIYQPNRPELIPFDYLNITEDDLETLCKSIFLTKSSSWSYENELRVIKHLENADKILKVSGQNVCLFGFDSTAIKNIFLGCRASEGFEYMIREILSEERYSHVGIFKESNKSSGYEITFEEIDK